MHVSFATHRNSRQCKVGRQAEICLQDLITIAQLAGASHSKLSLWKHRNGQADNPCEGRIGVTCAVQVKGPKWGLPARIFSICDYQRNAIWTVQLADCVTSTSKWVPKIIWTPVICSTLQALSSRAHHDNWSCEKFGQKVAKRGSSLEGSILRNMWDRAAYWGTWQKSLPSFCFCSMAVSQSQISCPPNQQLHPHRSSLRLLLCLWGCFSSRSILPTWECRYRWGALLTLPHYNRQHVRVRGRMQTGQNMQDSTCKALHKIYYLLYTVYRSLKMTTMTWA